MDSTREHTLDVHRFGPPIGSHHMVSLNFDGKLVETLNRLRNIHVRPFLSDDNSHALKLFHDWLNSPQIIVLILFSYTFVTYHVTQWSNGWETW